MSDSATLVRPEPLPRLSPEQLAAAGFLARYAGRTRDAYALDLRTFFGWCQTRQMEVFAMTRPHVELYVRWMLSAVFAERSAAHMRPMGRGSR